MLRTMRCYSELARLNSFEDRFNYLRLTGRVGSETFGSSRHLNQMFYRSSEWKKVRDQMIIRDLGCDLGVQGREIRDRIYIHHIEPITEEQILNRDSLLLDPENLIVVSFNTHNAIHYGDTSLLILDPTVRLPNDTCPWK